MWGPCAVYYRTVQSGDQGWQHRTSCGIDGDARLNVRDAASSAAPPARVATNHSSSIEKQLSVDCFTPQSPEVVIDDVCVRG